MNSREGMDAGDVETQHSRGAIWRWLFWLGVGTALYVLSTGPMVLLDEKNALSPGMSHAAELVYLPLLWTAEKTSLGKALGLYWHLWVPNRFDKDGKMIVTRFRLE